MRSGELNYGLENALWFQEKGKEPIEDVTFKRSNAFDRVGEEVRAVREKVGLIETTGFAKHEFSGPGAREFLENLLQTTFLLPDDLLLPRCLMKWAC